MRKVASFPVHNWVKNVYSLCVDRGVRGGFLYTALPMTAFKALQMSVKPQTYTLFPPSFTPALPTAFFSHFNPLITLLCTLSTGPIITKTN